MRNYKTKPQEHIESTHSTTTNTKQKGTLVACPECGRFSPDKRGVKSHWTNQHVDDLGAFPGADSVTIELEGLR